MGKEKFDKLSAVLQSGWGIELYKYKSVKAAYKVETSKGLMALKKVRAKFDKFSCVKQAQEYLSQNGFMNMAALIPALDGMPYYSENKDAYILSPWIDGKEPVYTSINHIQMIAYTLAELHNKSRGFRPLDIKIKTKYGKWPKKIAKKQRELQLYADLAKNGSEKFDKLFLEHAEWLIQRTQQACEMLAGTCYENVVSEAEVGYLCHGDTAVGNSVIKDSEMYFIDFDSMSQDLPVVDVWRLLKRALRRNQWSTDFVKNVIVAYEYNRPLSQDEKEILLALLIFPEKAWRLANRYYEKRSRSDWSAEGYYKELAQFLADREEMDRFILD